MVEALLQRIRNPDIGERHQRGIQLLLARRIGSEAR